MRVTAAVYYTEDERLAFTINAGLAHDAEGSNVPTSLGVSEGNILTLTVHHRAGNPAASGAPFVYRSRREPAGKAAFRPKSSSAPKTRCNFEKSAKDANEKNGKQRRRHGKIEQGCQADSQARHAARTGGCCKSDAGRVSRVRWLHIALAKALIQ